MFFLLNIKMGFYESIHDCGDGCYCVAIGTSLDDFDSTHWIYCTKHKDPKHRNIYYNLTNFTKRFAEKSMFKMVTGTIIDSKKNARNVTLIKLELNITKEEFDLFNLKDSKKLYFSEFDDEPSWSFVNNKIYVIDAINNFNVSDTVNSPECKDENIIFNWQTYTAMTIDEYEEWKKTKNTNIES